MSITIVNWNLNRAIPGSARAHRLNEFFKDSQADLFVFTETHNELIPKSGYWGVHSSTPDYSHVAGECMCSIWSRGAIDSLSQQLTDNVRCAAARIANSKTRSLLIFAMVLPWNGDSWRGHPSKDGQAFQAALEMYRQDWKSLQRRFPEDLLILAGDFNQDLVDDHYYGSERKKALLQDAFHADGIIPLTEGEYDPIRRDSPPHACIDHICISQPSDYILKSSSRWPETSEPEIAYSDHFAVTVTIG